MPDVDADKDLTIVRNHALLLQEHFDTVQIFCTRHESNDRGTIRVNSGTGNFFARYGQVSMWIEKTMGSECADDE